MVDWADLSGYLVSDFNAIERSPRLVEVPVAFDGAPTITTYASSALDGNDRLWVSIDSLVGPLGSFDLGSAVRAVGDVVCGGLAHMPIQGGDFLVMRHAMPLYDLPGNRINDFLIPLFAASHGALQIQQRFGNASAHGGFNQL